MSELHRLGKHTFAFGGDWREIDDDLDFAVDEARAKPGYHLVLSSGEEKQIALFDLPPQKGRIYSFAAQLAATGSNGIYVLPMPDGRLWYAAVRGGRVTPGTDRIDVAEDACRAIETMVTLAARSGDERSVFAPPEIQRDGWGLYDPKVAAQTIRCKALKRNAEPGRSPLAVAAAAILCLVGGVGWWQLVKIPADKRKAQEIEEINRQNYVALLTQQLQGIPRDHAWVNAAFDQVRAAAPYFAAGYTLAEVVCNPAACEARYESLNNTPRSPSLFVEALGGRGGVGPSGLTAIATIAVNAEVIAVDDSLLRSWPSGVDQTADRIGMLATYAPNLALDRDPVEEDLSAVAGTVPPGYAPIKRVTVGLRTKSAQMLHPSDLAAIADYWANSQYVPVSFGWTTGLTGSQEGWSIEFVRVSGGGM